MRKDKGFTLLEIMVAVGILGMVMTSLMVAFNSTVDSVDRIKQDSELMQTLRNVTDQFHRELTQALINNNRQDKEQIYFEIKQLAPFQSAIRFGCNTEYGLIEVGYQVKPIYDKVPGSESGDLMPVWDEFELMRMTKTTDLWNYNDYNVGKGREQMWPALDLNANYVEPFAFGIVGFRVRFWNIQANSWQIRDWDSLQLNALPKKVKIELFALTKKAALENTGLKTIEEMKNVETFSTVITLPQAK